MVHAIVSENSDSDKNGAADTSTALSAVDKTLAVLTAFGPGVDELGVTELARALGMTKPTVYRQLDALTRHGLVERHGGRYRLGPRLQQLADQTAEPAGDLWEALSPLVARLYEASHETVHLGVLRGDEIVVIGRLHPRERAAPSRIGATIPAHCTSLGKAILAYDTAALERIISRGLSAPTRNTIADPARLREELSSVRKTGLALCDRECRPDIASAAVSLLDPAGSPVAAISIVGRAGHLDLRRAGDLLRHARAEAASALSRVSSARSHRPRPGLTIVTTQRALPKRESE